jgi:hypothetical protein
VPEHGVVGVNSRPLRCAIDLGAHMLPADVEARIVAALAPSLLHELEEQSAAGTP